MKKVIVSLAVIAGVIAGLLVCYQVFWKPDKDALVVYCTHDSVYSEKILRDFERATKIPIVIKFDTEATKSLGLVELLIMEKEHPRCDVFWNNELLGMLRLKKEGVLRKYTGKSHSRIPEGMKDPEGYWAGFAARLRVYIINTEKMKADLQEAENMLKNDPGHFALAKPLYGTTLTHFAVLWNELGEQSLKLWFEQKKKQGLKIVSGNSAVKNTVAAGACFCGFTDTDDFFIAKDEGKPVDLLPVRAAGGKVICIPNTAAVIKGTKKLREAHKLIDYLLSAQTEVALARSASRQIPVGPVYDGIPEEVAQLKKWAEDAYDLTKLEPVYELCMNWLKKEYTP